MRVAVSERLYGPVHNILVLIGYAISQCSGESARMRRLARTFAARSLNSMDIDEDGRFISHFRICDNVKLSCDGPLNQSIKGNCRPLSDKISARALSYIDLRCPYR